MKFLMSGFLLVSMLSSPAFSADPPRENCTDSAVKGAVAWLNTRYEFTARSLENDALAKKDFASVEARARRIFVVSSVLLDSGLVVGSAGAFLAGNSLVGGGLLAATTGAVELQERALEKVKGDEGTIYAPKTVTDQSCVEFSKAGMRFSEGVTADLQAFQLLRAKFAAQAADEQSHIQSHWWDLGYGDLKYAHSLRLEQLREADLDLLENDYTRRALKIHAADCGGELR